MSNLETVQSEFDRTKKPPSLAVVEAIAAIENVRPTDLDQQLHDYIDAEALDKLMDNDVRVSFTVDQYEIRVNNESVAVSFC